MIDKVEGVDELAEIYKKHISEAKEMVTSEFVHGVVDEFFRDKEIFRGGNMESAIWRLVQVSFRSGGQEREIEILKAEVKALQGEEAEG